MTKLKRFYQNATVAALPEGWQVLLDGKSVRTPLKSLLVLPTESLAQAVAGEWNGQGESIVPDAMPLMQFSCAALDYVGHYREDVLDEAVEYAATDVLCYRAEEPEELAHRQKIHWQLHVNWAQVHYGVALRLTTGIMPVPQEEAALAAFRAELESLPLFRLTAVWLMAKHCSSLILPLAVHHRRITALEAHALSRLDETYQNERWGEDAEARAKRESGEGEMAAIGQFLAHIS